MLNTLDIKKRVNGVILGILELISKLKLKAKIWTRVGARERGGG